MAQARLTILNSMAGADFEAALDRHIAWGITDLDLRDAVYGHWLKSLPLAEARRAAAAIAARGLTVHCLSSSVFFGDIAAGEDPFRETHLPRLAHTIALAEIFEPTFVRIIAPQLSTRPSDDSAVDLTLREHPWVFDVIRDGVRRLTSAGFVTTVENEAGKCVLSHPSEFTRFFEVLDLGDSLNLTWDVQNQWATGVFPSLDTLDQLAPLIAYYHVKGGRYVEPTRTLTWNAALEDASWPVRDITAAVIERDLSPVICINPAQHGTNDPDYSYAGIVERDIQFMRTIPGVA